MWTCNLDACNVFEAMGTQWRVGMGGATGLDYSVLPAVMDLVGIEDRTEVFAMIRIMEQAALSQMAEGRE